MVNTGSSVINHGQNYIDSTIIDPDSGPNPDYFGSSTRIKITDP